MIDKGTLSSKIYDKLKKEIIKGNISPGEQLREVWIAKDLGVSATPVREAFKILETEGFIESIPYQGVRVKVYTTDNYRVAYMVRAKMESLALNLIMNENDDSKYKKLLKIIEKAQNDKKTPVLKRYIAFHTWVIINCNQDIVLKTISSIHALINNDVLFRELGGINEENHINNHEKLFEYIRAKDIEGAEKQIEYLLKNQIKELLE